MNDDSGVIIIAVKWEWTTHMGESFVPLRIPILKDLRTTREIYGKFNGRLINSTSILTSICCTYDALLVSIQLILINTQIFYFRKKLGLQYNLDIREPYKREHFFLERIFRILQILYGNLDIKDLQIYKRKSIQLL